MRCVISKSVIAPPRNGRTACDVARGAANHLPCLLTHRKNVLGAAVQRDHRGLVENDSLRARYTNVFAVPRSIARSRGRTCPYSPVDAGADGSGASARAGAQNSSRCCVPSSSAADCRNRGSSRYRRRLREERTTRRPRRVPMSPLWRVVDVSLARATGLMDCSLRAQSEPPAQCSCFQIGPDSFSVSMQKRAAANASSRWGDETATATDGSETARSPTRCNMRSVRAPGHRRRASVAISLMTSARALRVGFVGHRAHAVSPSA